VQCSAESGIYYFVTNFPAAPAAPTAPPPPVLEELTYGAYEMQCPACYPNPGIPPPKNRMFCDLAEKKTQTAKFNSIELEVSEHTLFSQTLKVRGKKVGFFSSFDQYLGAYTLFFWDILYTDDIHREAQEGPGSFEGYSCARGLQSKGYIYNSIYLHQAPSK
jgi:hypothetical protein